MTSEEQSCGTKLLTCGSALASSSPCQNSTVKSPDDDWRLENWLVWDPLSPPHRLNLMSEVWWVEKHVFFPCLCKCYSWWNHVVLAIFFPLAFCSASNCLVLFAFALKLFVSGLNLSQHFWAHQIFQDFICLRKSLLEPHVLLLNGHIPMSGAPLFILRSIFIHPIDPFTSLLFQILHCLYPMSSFTIECSLTLEE